MMNLENQDNEFLSACEEYRNELKESYLIEVPKEPDFDFIYRAHMDLDSVVPKMKLPEWEV